MIPLRSSEKGHISYRKVTQEMYREIERVHPFIAKYIKVYF
jgi:thymidylate synthase ThyX